MTKNRQKLTFGVILSIAIIFVLALAPVKKAHAETTGGFIHMSPVRTKLELKPGEVYKGTFKVMATGTETFDYTLSASPYQIVDEGGNASYDTESKYTKIVDWITFSKEGDTISPNESQDVSYTIKVPEDAPGGGQYAILFAETANPEEKGSFTKTNSRVGQILYVTIDGKNNECAKIIKNGINTFMFEPPISSTSLVESCGNVHQEASYIMKVYPLFSDKEIYTNEEDPETHIILPETKRFNTTSWTKENGAPSIGIYTVEHTVKIGKESDTVKKLVFIFPLWLLIVILLFLGSIIFWLVSRSRARKEAAKESRPRGRDED